MNTRRLTGLSALTLTAATGAALLAPAAIAAGPAQLEEITVTATRLETPLNEVTRSIAVVDREQLDTLQARSIAQALAVAANINVAGGPRAASQVVNVRGLTGAKILQTVDGARQSFESGHRPSYFLDPELLQRVEAVRGPASSLWGSGAIGGVIAQRTLAPADLAPEAGGVGGFAKGGYNGNNSGATATGALALNAGRSAWLLSGYSRESEDVELGNGDSLPGSGSESSGALFKADLAIADQQSLSVSFRQADWDGAVPSNGSAEISGTSNFLIEREQETRNGVLQYRLGSDSPWLDAEAMVYRNRVSMDEARLTDGRSDSTRVDAWGLSLANLSEIGDARLYYGVEAYEEDFRASRGGDRRPVPPRAESQTWSAFALAELPLASDWSLELGLRHDDFQTRALNLDSRTRDSATSPSAALLWTATDWLRLSLRHDRAFRAPGAEELYSSGFHFCLAPGFCNSFRPNPELAPEEAANTELGLAMAFDDLPLPGRVEVQAAVFHNAVDDFIEQVVIGPSFFPLPDPGYTSWFNVEAATLRGGELNVAYLVGNASLRAAYGVVRGEDDRSGEDLTNIPADTLKLEGAYSVPGLGLQAGLRYTYAREQDRTDYAANTEGITYDSYGVTDLYASWSPRTLAGLRFDLTLNNLEDRYYRQAWDQLYQSGRELILSARYRF